jgi:microsomal epoxide hydrolase
MGLAVRDRSRRMAERVEPFEVRIPDSVLEDLRERLARTRFPDALEGSDWDYGTELEYLRDLCAYWRDKFDWPTQERLLNRLPHYRTNVDGLGVHFIHARSTEPQAIPLVILHGWPGSVFNFYKVIEPLTDPVAHGGKSEDAFHVVAPSLPGYGWSDAPREPGFDVKAMAELIAKLMAQIGYERYGAQGGDWGAMIGTYMGLLDADHLCGLHLNMVPVGPPQGETDFTPEELAALSDMAHFQKEETGYQAIQGTKPQSLGYALNDSPSGLAAWIVEKYRTWTDCDGDVETRLSRDEILTNIMIYWATGSITSSMRLYCESRRAGRFGPADGRVEVPTGCAIFPKEIIRPSRRWAERRYNVTHWSEMPHGGHFPTFEEPEALVDDVRAFFRSVR